MEKFIGVKIIGAEPMTAGEAKKVLGDARGVAVRPDSDDGYLVQYNDEYKSWSPKDVFDEAYRRIDNMTFGLAIEAMKKGFWVKLPKWAKDVFIRIQKPDRDSKMTAPYFYVTSRFGLVPWIPTMIEMLSEEWVIIE